MDFTLSTTAAQLEARIRAFRPLELNVPWQTELIFPHYDGLAITNLAATIPDLLGVTMGTPLDNTVWGQTPPHTDQTIDRVVLFITDGLGYKWLNQLIEEDEAFARVIADLTAGRGAVPLTSVAPSTTTAALPSYWTGAPPGIHGIPGRFIYMREISAIADLLFYRPSTGSPGDLEKMWETPEEFLTVATIPEMLRQSGIPTHLLIVRNLMNTSLSRLIYRGVSERHAHVSFTDLWLRLHDVLRLTAGQRCYVSVYWEMVDSLSHMYGAHNDYLSAEIKAQFTALRDTLADPKVHDGRTLVLIAADHGHHPVPDMIDMGKDPALYDALRGAPFGDSRLGFLMLRDGKRTQAIDALARYSDRLAWVDPQMAFEAGLFGPALHPELAHRVGDLIVIPRLWVRLGYCGKPPESASNHGGLSDWEMLVPLLWNLL